MRRTNGRTGEMRDEYHPKNLPLQSTDEIADRTQQITDKILAMLGETPGLSTRHIEDAVEVDGGHHLRKMLSAGLIRWEWGRGISKGPKSRVWFLTYRKSASRD